ncbi:MAG: hypothetical protein ACN6OP_20875 [Pseudomonadales bacterium]
MTSATKKITWAVALLALAPTIALGQTSDEIAALETQKKAAELVKMIEEAKAAAGVARRNQLLNESQTETSLTEENKKRADAEKAELAAKLPTTTATALTGSVGTEGVKLIALGPVLNKLDEAAKELCLTSSPDNVLIFDRTLVDGIVAARLLQAQIKDLTYANKNIVAPLVPAPGQLTVTPKVAALLALSAVTTGIKAVADLAALFKTNVTTAKVDLNEPKLVFHTMLAAHCGSRILAVPGSYVGELDSTALDEMLASVKELVTARGTANEVADRKRKAVTAYNATLKKAEEAKDTNLVAAIKVQIEAEQASLMPLDEVLKQTDAFLLALKTADTTGAGPLVVASRFKALATRIQQRQSSVMLDLDVRAEGVTIVKDSIFTGQKLRIAGAAILSYKVLNLDGSIKFAKVQTLTTPFTELDLRRKLSTPENP